MLLIFEGCLCRPRPQIPITRVCSRPSLLSHLPLLGPVLLFLQCPLDLRARTLISLIRAEVSAVPSVNETLPVSTSLPESTSVEGGVEPHGAEDTPLPESAEEGLTVTEHPILLAQVPVEESASVDTAPTPLLDHYCFQQGKCESVLLAADGLPWLENPLCAQTCKEVVEGRQSNGNGSHRQRWHTRSC